MLFFLKPLVTALVTTLLIQSASPLESQPVPSSPEAPDLPPLSHHQGSRLFQNLVYNLHVQALSSGTQNEALQNEVLLGQIPHTILPDSLTEPNDSNRMNSLPSIPPQRAQQIGQVQSCDQETCLALVNGKYKLSTPEGIVWPSLQDEEGFDEIDPYSADALGSFAKVTLNGKKKLIDSWGILLPGMTERGQNNHRGQKGSIDGYDDILFFTVNVAGSPAFEVNDGKNSLASKSFYFSGNEVRVRQGNRFKLIDRLGYELTQEEFDEIYRCSPSILYGETWCARMGETEGVIDSEGKFNSFPSWLRIKKWFERF